METALGPPLTVSALTNRIKSTLESEFPFVEVEGEVSNARPAASGHLYFTLKDDTAALSAVMFRGRVSRLDFVPRDGQLVIASGNISVYARRGNYQIIVERLAVAGTGRILAELDRRKRKLAAEGLFDEQRKKRLPTLPGRVAVVTSPTGAALRDILQVLGRRHSGIDLVVCPTLVQGETAGPAIAKMIRIASRHRLGDVIIVTRGGGSVEDLLPFSDEEVVRAVAECELPVISAVGHETDWALCDFAADIRAPTPSAAAEMVSSSRDELRRNVHDLARNLILAFANRMRSARLLLRQFTPEELHRAYDSLSQPILQDFDRLREELIEAMRDRTTSARHKLELLRTELDSCSPYEVLSRGYAMVRNPEGKVLTDSREVGTGDTIQVRLSAGGLEATVEEVLSDGQL